MIELELLSVSELGMELESTAETEASLGEAKLLEGPPGVTFMPSVSETGTLSWTNDGGLENPEPVNIKGPQGEGDMDSSVYDPQGRAQDVFQYVDDAVGDINIPDVAGAVADHNTSETAHGDIRALIATKAPAYTYGTTDLEAGVSALATGTLYFVYE